MDRYSQSKKNLTILKSKLKKLEEKREIERLRKKFIRRVKIVFSVVAFAAISYFLFY